MHGQCARGYDGTRASGSSVAALRPAASDAGCRAVGGTEIRWMANFGSGTYFGSDTYTTGAVAL